MVAGIPPNNPPTSYTRIQGPTFHTIHISDIMAS